MELDRTQSKGNSSCPLPYPERFNAAIGYVTNLPEGKRHHPSNLTNTVCSHLAHPSGDNPLTEESKLLLYALSQQAAVGPCNEPRPWGWNVVNNAKWQSWKQLGDLSTIEAMRLYVRTLEEEIANWWELSTSAAPLSQDSADEEKAVPQQLPAHTSGSVHMPAKSRSVAEVVVEGSWVSPYITSDKKPPPRYEHAVALLNNQIYVIGGNCGGRYINDTWALNLEDLTWNCVSGGRSSALAAAESVQLVPTAGHTAIVWNGNILVIGGHTRAGYTTESLPVRSLDPRTGLWSQMSATSAEDDGSMPKPRGGHSATLLGSRLFIFGGEDIKRRPLNELWILDLTTMTWSQPPMIGAIPTPRGAHSAVSFRGRYILIFAGGSAAHCYSDLYYLDTHTMEWFAPEVEGKSPPPRAGHAGALLGTTWYIVGGGNNAAGCADMYSLDVSPLGNGALEWVLVGNTPPASAIASEGLSLLSVSMAGCLVSFGGYNGKYHNAIHVYRPEGYVVVKPPNARGPPYRENGRSDEKEASGAQDAAALREATSHEMSIMRRQLESAQAALAAAEKVAEGAKEALENEEARALRLEVEVAELKTALTRMGELEKELSKYRARETEETSRKPGLWGFISGADAAVDAK